MLLILLYLPCEISFFILTIPYRSQNPFINSTGLGLRYSFSPSIFKSWKCCALYKNCEHEDSVVLSLSAYQGVPWGFCFMMPQGKEGSFASQVASDRVPLSHQDAFVFSSSSYFVSYDSCKQCASSPTSQFTKWVRTMSRVCHCFQCYLPQIGETGHLWVFVVFCSLWFIVS